MPKQLQVLFIGLILAIGSAWSSSAAAKQPVARLGSLVPVGTSYHKILQQMGEEWRQAPGGGVRLLIQPGGSQGGEGDMVNRMRARGLQVGLLTVTGLSEIDKSVAALQKMPLMFRTWEEIDFVREKLRGSLEQKLEARGFVVLSWGDGGWVRFFSKEKAVHPNDLKKMKIFAWAGDNSHVDLMKALGYNPVSLETDNILPSLQTGMINVVPTTPFFALTGQFYATAPNMLDLAWVPIVGAMVVEKKFWDQLPAETRTSLKKSAEKAGDQLRTRGRLEDKESVEAMQKRGLKVTPLTPEAREAWEEFAKKIHPQIRGKIVPAEFFDQVQKLLAEYRAGGKP